MVEILAELTLVGVEAELVNLLVHELNVPFGGLVQLFVKWCQVLQQYL